MQLMYTKCIQNARKMYYTYWQELCIRKEYIIRTMYTICIQNLYKMYTNNYMQNISHISTYF